MFRVQLFGAFAVQHGPPEMTPLGTSARRLASYLFSFPNESHRREKILDQFWPEFDPAQSRAALSTTLWRISQLVENGLESSIALRRNPREIRLDIKDPNIVDAHYFRAISLSALLDSQPAASIETLHQAASLYTAPFLEEYDEDWVLEMRERLQSLYLRVLTHLMRWYAKHNRYEDALFCGRRILISDPTRESVQRAVMLLFVVNGQRAEAIRQFKRCEAVLRRECDVAPMPQTYSLLTLIKSDEISLKLPHLLETEFAGTAQSALTLSSF
jgi:DNA-binding SARP family transcriptional activator